MFDIPEHNKVLSLVLYLGLKYLAEALPTASVKDG